MQKFKQLDRVTGLLIVFVIVLLSLFYNLFQIEKSMETYSYHHDEVIALKLLNKGLDDVTQTSGEYLDNVAINKDLSFFQAKLTKLKQSLEQNGYSKLFHFVEKMENSFLEKMDDIEYFKSLNASLINGSHFLFDLQKTIASNHNIDSTTKNLINEILFYLFQYSQSDYIQKEYILKELVLVKKGLTEEQNNTLVQNFYKQSHILLETFANLKELSLTIRNNTLEKDLNRFHIRLNEQYSYLLLKQRGIATFFFLFSLVILIVLLFLYQRTLKDQKELLEQNKKLKQAANVYENTEEAIIIANADAEVISVNKSFTTIYGYKEEEVLKSRLSILHSGFQDECFYRDMWNQINSKGFYEGKLVNKTKNGKKVLVWVNIKAIHDHKDEVVNYISIQTDLRAIEKSEAKIDFLAYHDPLTGVHNRTSFEQFLTNILALSKHNGSKFATLFIDIDRFKVINDTLGHDIGDQVLIHVTKRLKDVLRESDVISRWGGDEFVIIVQDVSSESFVANIVQNIIDNLKEPILVDYHQFMITASIGIALYPHDGDDEKTLIKHADSAMYLAKEMGRNGFRFYSEQLSLETEERLHIDIALYRAIENNELFVVFQPQYSLKTGKMVSAEALVRWENSELGFVSPEKFIPIAEDNGVIVTLGYFVFEEACKGFRRLKDAGKDIKRISINISSIQFQEPGFVKKVLGIVRQYSMHPSEVELEITERFFMQDTQENIEILNSFRSYGFVISIDDFGTGYSSMSYLQRLPIDTIKIDKSFVDEIEGDHNAIIEAIVLLAKTLDFCVVAEGIETKEQERYLAALECDIGQGYLFSKPLKLEDLLEKF